MDARDSPKVAVLVQVQVGILNFEFGISDFGLKTKSEIPNPKSAIELGPRGVPDASDPAKVVAQVRFLAGTLNKAKGKRKKAKGKTKAAKGKRKKAKRKEARRTRSGF